MVRKRSESGALNQPQVFVSYARQDSDRVHDIVRLLEQAGVTVWRDCDRILGGQYYGEQIVHAIAHSRVVLLMCSAHAFQSDNVHREVLLTWDYHRRFIPVWLCPPLKVPERYQYCLVGCQWIDAHSEPPERWLPQLVEAFKTVGVDNRPGLRFRPGDRPIRGASWELERLLGKGGFGEVWKARNSDSADQPSVALKFCLDLSERARELLGHEADMVLRAQQHIESDGIVPLLHAYLDNDPPCLEYPYIEGGTLVSVFDECRETPRSFTRDQLQRIIQRIAEIVGAAHRATPMLIHRDLKPSNIMIKRLGAGEVMVRVMDFGIGAVSAAPAADRSRTSLSIEGNVSSLVTGAYSPLYASPQQVRRDEADPRDDVYALGVIWYQLLTGDMKAPAPTGKRWVETLRRNGVRRSEIDLMSSCFETDPAHRPSDAGVLAARLEALLSLGPRALEAGQEKGQRAASPQPPEVAESRRPQTAFPHTRLSVRRTGIVLKPSNSRVLLRPFEPTSEQRIERILARIASLSEWEVDKLLADVMSSFHGRHQLIRGFFLHRFEHVKKHLLTEQPLSENRRMLIGSSFTQEYALESAALFHPSMVWHPDQSQLEKGARRFLLSLRATGEGSVSSITFRCGTIDAECRIRMDEPTRFVTAPEMLPNALYEKTTFFRKLIELGIDGPFVEKLSGSLNQEFTREELRHAVGRIQIQNRPRGQELQPLVEGILALASANYEISYSPEHFVSERVIFPSSPIEANGIEDARFVQFTDDDGSIRYYATSSAFDGKAILPQIIETDDFLDFKISTLHGPVVQNSGFALFPRKIRRLYAMLSRQDNENMYLMYSEQLEFWHTKELIAKPTYAWEFIQIGNCGSPIETEAGWLVLTHGVSSMRNYALGAMLLDLDDPSRVIGRLEFPLLEADANEREGSVPNGVYSCGGALHHGEVIIPYSMSDFASTFATVPLDELLTAMRRQ